MCFAQAAAELSCSLKTMCQEVFQVAAQCYWDRSFQGRPSSAKKVR